MTQDQRRRNPLLSLLILTLVAAIARSESARADDAVPNHPALKDPFYFALGAFVPKTSTSAQLNSPAFPVGTVIDFERALGMETQKVVPEAFARWRFAERWRLELAYFELNRSGDAVIQQEIHWGDQDFLAGTEIQSKFDFSDLRTSVGYSVFKRPDKDVGVALGIHAATYDVSLSAVGTGLIGGSTSEEHKLLAPLPVLSIYGQFALTDEWAVETRLDRFAITFNNIYGNITSSVVDLNYQPFRHVGFGIGYRSFFINVRVTRPSWTAIFSQSYQGPFAYMNASF